MAHLLDDSAVQTSFLYVLGNQKDCVTCLSQYLLYCIGLEPNLQQLWGTTVYIDRDKTYISINWSIGIRYRDGAINIYLLDESIKKKIDLALKYGKWNPTRKELIADEEEYFLLMYENLGDN